MYSFLVVCMYTYLWIYVYIQIYSYKCCMYTFVCIYVFIQMYTYKCIHTDVSNKYKLLHNGLSDIFKVMNPRIAVLGINPHAGESGTIGDEEQNIILPAIEELQQEGFDASGPISADTVFTKIKYDGVLSMYHDQALPVLKTIDFHKTVNITLGLPFLRISVDHGTAEDIARNFTANQDSMTEALLISLAKDEA